MALRRYLRSWLAARLLWRLRSGQLGDARPSAARFRGRRQLRILPAPNGIHFHAPASLWVQTKEQAMNPVIEQLDAHDLDDTRR